MFKAWRQYLLVCLSLIIILPSLWPLSHSGFFRMHDFTHVARLVELDLALKDGQIPPRWAPDFGWGYGMPLFHFYSPLPYFLAEIFYLLKISAVGSIKLVFGLNFIAGFWFMYLWAKDFWGKIGGVISAVAFVYLPYRAVLFYVRGALAELTAMTFLPLFFYSSNRLVKTREKKYLILTSLAITGVFLSHNVIALFALSFFPLYFVFKLLANLKIAPKKLLVPFRLIWLALFSAFLAFGLSAFFIVPAFLENSYTIVSSIAGGYSHYSLHFIYLRQLIDRRWAYGGSVAGPFDDISFQIGLPHLFLAGLSLVTLYFSLKKREKDKLAAIVYCYIAILLSVFMMTYHAKPVWDNFKFLHIAQFPWRFLSYLGVFTCFLAGSIWSLLKSKKLIFALATGAILATFALNFSYFKPEKPSDGEEFYYTDRVKIKIHMSDTLFDYLPKWAKKNPPLEENFYQGLGRVEVIKLKTGLYHFKTEIEEDKKEVLINSFYFPGWKVFIDGKEEKLNHDNSLGVIGLTLPQGVHEVIVKLTKTPIQFWSDTLSFASWLGLLGYVGLKLKQRR